MNRTLGSILGLALSLAALTACAEQQADAKAPQPTTSQAPTQTENATTPVIDYSREGVFVEHAGDADKLTGASESFKEFVASEAERLQAANECKAAVGVTVQKIMGDYARGGINECGGYVAVWGVEGGEWTELFGTQSALPCADLDKKGVPRALIDCDATH